MTEAAVLAALAGLALLGALDALYFVLVTYRRMRPDPRWLPRVCRMDRATCARIVDTPQARILGLPNALYGFAWYLLVVGAAAYAWATGAWPLCPVFLAASLLTVFVSAYLFWSLVHTLRVACPLCFLGHALNVGILVLLAPVCL